MGLLRDPRVQSLTLLYAPGPFADGCVYRGRKILEGESKHGQWHGDPLEPNPAVRRERTGHYAVGGIRFMPPWWLSITYRCDGLLISQ